MFWILLIILSQKEIVIEMNKILKRNAIYEINLIYNKIASNMIRFINVINISKLEGA